MLKGLNEDRKAYRALPGIPDPTRKWKVIPWSGFLADRRSVSSSGAWRQVQRDPDPGLKVPLSADAALVRGQQVGHYRLIEERGVGGFAIVWEAEDVHTHERFALKILKEKTFQEELESRQISDRFRRECALLKQHAEVPRLIGPVESFAVQVGDGYREVLRMPLLARSLAEEVKELRASGEPPSLEQVLEWGLQTLEALEALHARGVVHRDIKPSNLLLDEQGEVVITDLGIALVDDGTPRLTRTNDALGSDIYVAPEQRESPHEVEGRADVYSLAVTLNELMLGRVSSVLGKGIAGPFGELLRRMGDLDHERRPSSTEALREFRTLLDGLQGGAAAAQVEASRLEEAQRVRLEAERVVRERAEEAKRQEEAKEKAEEAKRQEEAKEKAEEAKRQEEARQAQVAREREEEAKRKEEAKRQEEAKRKAEAKRKEEEARLAQAARDKAEAERAEVAQRVAALLEAVKPAATTATPSSVRPPEPATPGGSSATVRTSVATGPAKPTPEKPGVAKAEKGDAENTPSDAKPDASSKKASGTDAALGCGCLIVLLIGVVWGLKVGISAGIEFFESRSRAATPSPPMRVPVRVPVVRRPAATVHPAPVVPAAPPRVSDASLTTPAPQAPAVSLEGMQRVPGGAFSMGSPDGVGDDDQHPQHSVTLATFWIDRTEVTVDAFETCVRAGACTAPTAYGSSPESSRCNWRRSSAGDHPVNCVQWAQADAFCRWRGKSLPTEAEWEVAARGPAGLRYPWGDSHPSHRRYCDTRHATRQTCAVGSHPDGASPFGVEDMAGNVGEWLSDEFRPYAGWSFEIPTHTPAAGHYQLRGGHASLEGAHRIRYQGDYPIADLGFRCVHRE